VLRLDAAVRAGGDRYRLVEHRWARQHLGGDRIEVLREGGRALVLQQALEVRVRGARGGEAGDLAAQLLDLARQLAVLALRVEEAAGPARRVAERLRDARRRDLERPQHGDARSLDAVEPVGAEADREQDER